MDRRSYLKTSLVVGGGLLLPAGVLALVGRSHIVKHPELSGFDGKIMGTGYSVRLGRADDSAFKAGNHSAKELAVVVHSVLQDVDAHMSTWRADSEVSVFNRSVDSDWQRMTPATTSVIAHALQTSDLSVGAFDVTVGPLIDLWGFGAGALKSLGQVSNVKPATKSIREVLAQVGYNAIDIDLDKYAVRKRNPNVQVDLSGIAKGHAVDRVASLLDDNGVESYLVEVGGELRSRGAKPDGSLWRVAIERPSVGPRDVFRILQLDNKAVATSGNYRNFFTENGQHYSHAIDPRTGQSVTHELASVSVVANTTMDADALSTAMMIMGPHEAFDFAEQNQIAAHFMLNSSVGLKEVYSSEFESLIV